MWNKRDKIGNYYTLKEMDSIRNYDRRSWFRRSREHDRGKTEDQRMKDIRYIIADNVRAYRRKEGLTQMELAELADLSLDSIKRIENGSRTMSLENFLRISDALRVPISSMVYENELTMSEVEQVRIIFENRDERQRKYLLHMLWEMAKELDKLV